jgi:hypothetical protein
MPPVVIAGGIAAAASLASAKMSQSAANKGTKAQSEATAQALAFEREQKAAAEARYKQGLGLWNARQKSLLDYYGIPSQGLVLDPSAITAGGPAGAMPDGAVPRPTATASTASPAAGPANVGEMLGPQGDWSDWRRYGLKQA